MLLPHLLEPQSSGRRPTLRMLRANTSLYSAGLRRCARRFSGTVSPETMNSSRSSGRIRMEVTYGAACRVPVDGYAFGHDTSRAPRGSGLAFDDPIMLARPFCDAATDAETK